LINLLFKYDNWLFGQEVAYVTFLPDQSGTVNLKHFGKYVTYEGHHVSYRVWFLEHSHD